MKLIPATEQDIAFGRRVHHAAYRDMALRQYGTWDEAVQDGFFERAWASHPHHIILDHKNERCGYCAIERTETEIILREIAIAPEGQGNGVGGSVIQLLITEGDEQRLPVKVNVMKTNLRAKHLYERLGFCQFGDNDTHFLMERPCANKRMESNG